ncbi:hypothetical protein GIB67_010353 [Kingdonia uniflora]|uniref:Uncharacterized protein n=1 Tax=Kingdonia uniflora TaxID=39325 RepID=A0A7J7MA75_9MAGN|nr:hypothetical protein GIB67_010353 [Kingdonia uniflora]
MTSSLFFPSPLLSSKPNHLQQFQLKPQFLHLRNNPQLSTFRRSSQSLEQQGPVSVVDFEDLLEKDWSFLDSFQQQPNITNRIITSGEVTKSSRVLVSIGTEGFVTQLVGNDSSKCECLLVVHDSIFVLAGIKELYDGVKCWQGEIVNVPEKWGPFDVVFLWFLPGLPFKLIQILGALTERCSPGARLIISHPHGREGLERQRQEYPDVVVSDLPDKIALEKVSDDHSFQIKEFVDQPDFYLAVLKFGRD